MDLGSLYKAVGVLSTLFFIFVLAVTIVTFRKARKTSPRSIIFTVIMSIAVLAIYAFFTDSGLTATVGILLVVAGLVVGVVWAQATQVYRDETGQAFTRNTVWYLAVWGFFVVLSQMTILFSSESAVYSIGFLALTTGAAVGMNGSILARLGMIAQPMTSIPGRTVLPAPAGVTSAEPALFCRHCGARLEGSDLFCRECGGSVG